MTATASNEASSDTPANLPRHIAIIMDGNGRWARKRGLPRLAGHRAGTENIRRMLQAIHETGVQYLTLFAFSTENWGRPDSEVEGLFEILHSVIREEANNLHQQNVQIRHLGTTERLPINLATSITDAVKLTENNTGLCLCVAFDYGGRGEIVDTVRKLILSGISASEIDETVFAANLYLPDVPDPDLIIRTAGEQRISNFLIWQAAYSEFYQTDVYWPDFDSSEIKKAITSYLRRRRKFGRLADDS